MPSTPSSTRSASRRPELLAVRQVDLGNIAGNDCLGAEAQSGEEHFHLLGRSVLRLIEDDEAVIQGTAAHIRQRCDLDGAALLIFGEIVRAEHIKQAVVQRAQIRVYLALQIAGQKAQLLACLDRRTGQDDAGYLLVPECLATAAATAR